jgi:hypothetical protein
LGSLIFFGFFNGIQQLIRILLFADNSLLNQLFPVFPQGIDIRHILKISQAHQLLYIYRAKAFDIHRIPAHEVDDAALSLRWAVGRGAAQVCRVFFPLGLRAAGRAGIRKAVWSRAIWAFLR